MIFKNNKFSYYVLQVILMNGINHSNVILPKQFVYTKPAHNEITDSGEAHLKMHSSDYQRNIRDKAQKTNKFQHIYSPF